MTPQEALKRAIRVGGGANCHKSKRGVVIFHRSRGAYYSAANGPPWPFHCDGSDACRASCRHVAVHAEARAILAALAAGVSLREGWELLHVKVSEGEAVASGGPSCVACSLLILESGLSRVHLYQNGALGRVIQAYAPSDFHELSLQANNLPVVRRGPHAPTL